MMNRPDSIGGRLTFVVAESQSRMKLAALALMTTLGLGGAAYADPPRPRGEARQLLLERFDRDHDGRLEPQERRRAIRALRRLARRLAMQDLARRPGGHVPGMVRRFDTNGDGTISPDEMPSGAAGKPGRARGRFRRFDANGDGVISPDEIPPGAADRQGRARKMLRRFDTNGDGVVGPDEMPPGAARKLRPLDRNGDGWLDDSDQP